MNTNAKIIVTTVLGFAVSSAALGNVVYSQPTTSKNAEVGLGWYSSSETRPTRNFKHADNFVLDEDQAITSVRWWGLTEGVSHTDLSNFDSFTIEFYTNRTMPNGNIRPLQLFASTTLDIADTNALTTGRSTASGALEYVHEAQLDEAVDLTAGETYWIAISARSIDPRADVWQWQDSDLFDTRSSSFSYSQNRWLVFVDTDSAFELFSVPAPGSIAAFTLCGLIAQRRRRQAR